MCDEEAYFKKKENAIIGINSALAHQITMQHEYLQRFNAQHTRKSQRLAKLPRFTSSLELRDSREKVHSDQVAEEQGQDAMDIEEDRGQESWDVLSNGGNKDTKDKDSDDENLLAEMVHWVLQISSDV